MAQVISADRVKSQDFEFLLSRLPSQDNFPEHSREQALREMERVFQELKVDGDHLTRKTREHHARDLPAAFRIGVNLEYVQEHGLYLPTYPDTMTLGMKITGLGESQLFKYRIIGRGLKTEWLEGWDLPKGIEAAAVVAEAPLCVRYLLFCYLRQGRTQAAIVRGRLAAEDAISEDREDEAGDWLIRAMDGESTTYERAVRAAREQEKKPRKPARAKPVPTLMQQVGNVASLLQRTAGGVGELEVLLDQPDISQLDAEGVERLIALAEGVSHKLTQLPW